jgi:hypothetical protein
MSGFNLSEDHAPLDRLAVDGCDNAVQFEHISTDCNLEMRRNIFVGENDAEAQWRGRARCRAFDEAWSEIEGNYGPRDVESARLRLATALLSVATEDSGGTEARGARSHGPCLSQPAREQAEDFNLRAQGSVGPLRPIAVCIVGSTPCWVPLHRLP